MKYILWVDLADKYSFFGMKAILPTFLLNRVMISESAAVAVMQLSLSATYLTMVVCAFVAGRILSHLHMLAIAAVVSFMGHCIMGWYAGYWSAWLGIMVVSAASGVIKVCMPAMIVEQCEGKGRVVSRAMSMIYIFTNIGTISILLTPLIYDKLGYTIAFVSCTLAMLLAVIILFLGRHEYAPATRYKPLTFMANLSIMRELFRIAFIVSVFYVFMSQIYSSWVIQGIKMNGNLFGHTVFPAQMQFLDTVFVVCLMPLIMFYAVPALQKRGYGRSIMTQISIGLLFSVAAFLAIAILQMIIDRGVHISLMWQCIPYLFISIAEILVIATATSYLFASLPMDMSVIIGLVLAGFGFMANTFFAWLFRYFRVIDVWFFLFCAAVMFLLAICSTLIRQLETPIV